MPGTRSKLQGSVIGFFNALALQSIRHPLRGLSLAALVTLIAAPGIRTLKLRTDGHALLDPNAPEVLYDKSIRGQFGVEDRIVVLIRSSDPDGIFNPGTVQLVRDLTAELARIPGVNPTDVMSLATECTFRPRPDAASSRTLLEAPLKTRAELDRLRDDLRRIELYTGTLLSRDGRSTVILLGTPPGSDRTLLYRQVLDVITAKQSRLTGQDDIAVTGEPVAEALLGIHILEDLGVPKAMLDASPRPHPEPATWHIPASFGQLRLFIARRIGLVPVAVLVMMLVLLVSFRNLPAMLVPLPGVLATILFVFGVMGWFGIPIYLTTAVMPVMLVVTGLTNDVYLFSRYFTLLRERPGDRQVELLGETFRAMSSPVVITSLTAGIGFLSFGFSPLGPVRAFGVCTGIGVLFGLFYSFTGVPALLALINPERLISSKARARSGQSALAGWFGRLGTAAAHRRYLVAVLLLLITAITPLGLRRLAVQDSWIDGFDPDSEFRRDTLRVNEQFFGIHTLLVCSEAPEALTGQLGQSAFAPGTIALPIELVDNPVVIRGSSITLGVGGQFQANAATDSIPGVVWRTQIEGAGRVGTNIYAGIGRSNAPPDFWEELSKAGHARFEIAVHSQVRPGVIRSIGGLASFIRERGGHTVGGVLSPLDYLATTRFMTRPDDPEARLLTDDPAEIKLLWEYYGWALGTNRLRQVVDTNYWQSLTTVFLKDANFVDTARLMSGIRAYEHEHLTPHGIKIGFAGDVAVSQSLIRGIVTTQLQSLIWSLAGIFTVTALFGGSIRAGFYCLLPSALAVLVKFAVMGWLGIPLGVATSMFAAMTLGIGVNCAIHLLEGFRQARAAGATHPEALSCSLRLTGPPALINTLAMTLGFGVLMLSQVPANARLGILVVLGLVNCFVASLLILPVLLHWWPPKNS